MTAQVTVTPGGRGMQMLSSSLSPELEADPAGIVHRQKPSAPGAPLGTSTMHHLAMPASCPPPPSPLVARSLTLATTLLLRGCDAALGADGSIGIRHGLGADGIGAALRFKDLLPGTGVLQPSCLGTMHGFSTRSLRPFGTVEDAQLCKDAAPRPALMQVRRSGALSALLSYLILSYLILSYLLLSSLLTAMTFAHAAMVPPGWVACPS